MGEASPFHIILGHCLTGLLTQGLLNYLGQGSAHYGPWAKPQPPPVFVSRAALGTPATCSPALKAELQSCDEDRDVWLAKPEIFTIWLFIAQPNLVYRNTPGLNFAISYILRVRNVKLHVHL